MTFDIVQPPYNVDVDVDLEPPPAWAITKPTFPTSFSLTSGSQTPQFFRAGHKFRSANASLSRAGTVWMEHFYFYSRCSVIDKYMCTCINEKQ